MTRILGNRFFFHALAILFAAALIVNGLAGGALPAFGSIPVIDSASITMPPDPDGPVMTASITMPPDPDGPVMTASITMPPDPDGPVRRA
jgi:hypothetical protein